MDVYLDTERLVLRRFPADDADLLIERDSDLAGATVDVVRNS